MIRNYVSIFKDFLYITKKRKTSVVVQLFLSSALSHISSLLPPIATAQIIAMISDANMHAVCLCAILYVVFYIIYFAAQHWNYHTYTTLAEHYHVEVQKDLFEKLASHDDILEQASKGKIMDTCNTDVCYIVDTINAFAESLMNILKLVIIFGIFMYYNVYVGIFVLVLDLFYLIVMDKNSSNVSRCYEGQRKYDDKMLDILNQMLTNLKQVKALNLMPNLNVKLANTRKKWCDKYLERRKYLTDRYCMIPILVYLGKIILYIILAYLVIIGTMTLDKLVLLISYFETTITATDTMLDHLLDLNNYKVQMKRIRAILSYIPKKELDFGEIDNDYIDGVVEFKNVDYKLKRGRYILKDVTFKLYPNEINAIVGHSGSGKTTIINLLYRLRKVHDGKILIDGINIYDYTKDVYVRNVSGVYQKPFVFEMSIRDNLNLVDRNKARQIEVCKRVGIHKIIEELPNGYNTIISDDENTLTIGEKQLLAIARALLSKAEILLFDEITGNIDTTMTEKIASVILDLKTDHTIIMVTHKPEMMDIADRVVVLNQGKVVCKGRRENVHKRCSLYRELHNRTFASISLDE